MAFREVTMLEVREVLRLWLKSRTKKGIARQVGLDPKTVRRYVRSAEACGLSPKEGVAALTEERLADVLVRLKDRPVRPKGDSWTACETHRQFIADGLKNKIRLSKVRKLLKRRGVDVPYATLHRFAVAELEFGRTSTTIPVADCEPGQEVQVDTGWMGYLKPDASGKRRRFRAWIFTAVRSRHRFVWPCFRETTESAIEACEEAWAFFGGIFVVMIPDNTKAIVQRADPLSPLITEAFREYAQARDFEIDPTRSRHPKDKARVERAVPTVRDDCFAGETLCSLDDARRHARWWSLNDYGMRRHTRTQRLPLEAFDAEEKAALNPAPSQPYEIPLWADPKVARDQHAQVDKALYSLPTHFRGKQVVGKRLRARADRTTVRFYLDGLLVKAHPRKPPGGRSTDPADFPPEKAAYAMRDIDFLKRQARKHGESVGIFADALLDGPLPWTRMRRVYALLGLCKRFGSQRVDQACALALEVDMFDVRRLQRMLKLGPPPSAPTPACSPKVIPIARYLRPSSQYALPFDSTPQQQENPSNEEND